MLFPQSYADVYDKVNHTILFNDPHEIIIALTHESSIGPIIPLDHFEKLDLSSAIYQIQESKYDDIELINQVHITIEEYFNIVIDYYNLIYKSINSKDYFNGSKFDKEYLYAEKLYLNLFGIYSPRILFLNSSNFIGDKILYHEIDGIKYTFCPLKETETQMKKCKDCPLVRVKKQENGLKSLNLHYCKYRELIGYDDDDEEF